MIGQTKKIEDLSSEEKERLLKLFVFEAKRMNRVLHESWTPEKSDLCAQAYYNFTAGVIMGAGLDSFG
jgi:hypothetical protein